MKKHILLAASLVCMLSLAACGTKAEEKSDSKAVSELQNQSSKASRTTSVSSNELDEIIAAIDHDGEALIESLKTKYSEVKKSAGDSYESLKNNYQDISDFYDYVDSESASFYEKLDSYYETYYKQMLRNC